jgi:hypothetical protein
LPEFIKIIKNTKISNIRNPEKIRTIDFMTNEIYKLSYENNNVNLYFYYIETNKYSKLMNFRINKSDLLTHLDTGNITAIDDITKTNKPTVITISDYILGTHLFKNTHSNVNVNATTYDIKQDFFERHNRNVKLLVIHSVSVDENNRGRGYFKQFINDVHSKYDIIIAENSVSWVWRHYEYQSCGHLRILEKYHPLSDAYELHNTLQNCRIKIISHEQ